MIEQLLSWDTQAFLYINKSLANSFLDGVMPFITDLHKEPWFALTVTPMILFIWIYTARMRALKVIAGFCLLIAITDNVNNRMLKPYFARPRPPQTLNKEDFNLRTERFAGYSFPSNHAANNFAGATFLSLVYPWLTPFAFFIAFFVSYSRIYVGVHYPGDILVAAIWASLFAWGFYHTWRISFLYYTRKTE